MEKERINMNKLHCFEFVFGEQKDYIAAYSMEQADFIYVSQILSKANDNEREVIKYLMSDERIQSLNIELKEPGVCKIMTKETALETLETAIKFIDNQNDCAGDSGSSWQSYKLEEEIKEYYKAFSFIKGLLS